MTDTEGLYKVVVQELENVVTCDCGESDDERESLVRHEETVSDDIPPSLLSYCQASRTRADMWEEFILEEGEDESKFQSDVELEENVEVKNLKTSPTDDEVRRSIDYEKVREEQHSQETETEEDKMKRRQRDFQEELRKIMEAEKRHQKDLEMIERRAQERLELEFHLQQQLIKDLQKRVNEERRMNEEEQKRIQEEREKKMREEQKRREEEERRKRKWEEEEKVRREAVRKRMEEERRQEEKRRQKEEDRIRKEMERNKVEEEERRKKNEVEIIRKITEKQRMEEERKKKGGEDEKRKSEEKTLIEKIRAKQERRKMEEEERKQEKDKKWKLDSMKNEEEEKKLKEVGHRTEETVNWSKEEESKKTDDEESLGTKKNTTREEDEPRTGEDIGQRETEVKGMSDESRLNREEEQMMAVGLGVRSRTEEIRNKEEEETETFTVTVTQMKRRKDEEEEEKSPRLDGEDETKDGGKTTRTEEQGRCPEEELENEKNFNKTDEEEKNKTDEEEKCDEDKRKKKEELSRPEQEEEEEEERGNEDVDNGDEEKTNTEGEPIREETTTIIPLTSSGPSCLVPDSRTSPSSSSEEPELLKETSQTSVPQTVDQDLAAVCLPEQTEQKRLSWMKNCTSWSKLSVQNKNKKKTEGGAGGGRGAYRTSRCSGLPALCPQTLLQATGCTSLQQLTSVTLEDLPGCSLSTLAQCGRLQCLTLRRCGLKSLDSISLLPELCYIDVQENEISFMDCGNMTSLRVLRLGHNKLTSIHGLAGAQNLDLLDLSHNSITRIAGLGSVKRLQSLSLSHNRLVSTKGLRDVSTLLHLDCSHNYLAAVEGLENNVLLHTLDLKSNSLVEAPSLTNHVLLRDLHLDENSISSLQSLTDSWLPLLLHLSAAQNRITVLSSMSDFISLAKLDLQFNCISELNNMCESLEGCSSLQEIHLRGNALQQENNWRSALQKTVTGLRSIDGEETDSPLSAPAVQQVSLAPGSFTTFCQAHLKQTGDLQQQHSTEVSKASSCLDAVKTSCRHYTERLKLAVEQRLAHEHGNTVTSVDAALLEETLDEDSSDAETPAVPSQGASAAAEAAVTQSQNKTKSGYWSVEEKSPGATGRHSTHRKLPPVSDDPDQVSISSITHRWNGGNIISPSTTETGGEGEDKEPITGCSDADRPRLAATVIQAFWRGFTLRRRLASALAAVTWADGAEEEPFEEVDVDEFVFDEAAEDTWTVSPFEAAASGHLHLSEEPISVRRQQHELYHTSERRPVEAWLDEGQEDTSEEDATNRTKPAASSTLSGISARSERILEEWNFKNNKTALLMLKRAQKMKSRKQQQKNHWDPSVCQQGPAETRNRPAARRRSYMKVSKTEQTEQMERVKLDQDQQRLLCQSDRDLELSDCFLPKMSSDILKGGRVQLVVDPSYSESGLWVSNSQVVQSSKGKSCLRRTTAAGARDELQTERLPWSHMFKSSPGLHLVFEFLFDFDLPDSLCPLMSSGLKKNKMQKKRFHLQNESTLLRT
ncbi:leucine-rich repeat and IQ domain-containing protein 1 isoform X3 [Cynoglossus semilaevis]|uniref:leucine-rich repeat and IQ domain-containing protein 1 isoform X3 n=1 Tax=Cynoglossus semilaevis TaxID=244447 RepID=UPI000D625992|nr:leucine-rich repeat and IQ domain-containing protein 1 isoform X3 [Cynoglossus semilaevis]